ncbi:MAG: ORF6N domain-containing protein [Deltaproteobacteria bacterium]|nr:MAG: ORF6N domain-containing protein [Deltaproteobacteria bacterium]
MEKITPKMIESMIYIIRGQKVMFDGDLAELYEVETKVLKRAVRRNIERFPHDFMFELTKAELENWRYQFGTSNKEKMGLRIPPFVFTEQGVTMLSSVLKSPKAIQLNISIVRIFIKMRKLLLSEESLTDRVEKLEKGTDKLFRVVFDRLDKIEDEAPILPKRRKRIGLKK